MYNDLYYYIKDISTHTWPSSVILNDELRSYNINSEIYDVHNKRKRK